MAEALGARFMDDAGDLLPRGGGSLGRLASVDVSGLDERLQQVQLIVACDVTNPLCGEQGLQPYSVRKRGHARHGAAA